MKSSSKLRVWFASVMLTAYVGFVLLVTLTPSPVDKPFQHDLQRILEELHDRGLPGFVGYDFVEFSSNVALFIPIGFVAALLLPRRGWWLVLLVGPLFSVAIEFLQHSVLPERYATVSDVLANSIGTLIGALFAVLLRLLTSWRDRLVLEQVLAGRNGVDLLDA